MRKITCCLFLLLLASVALAATNVVMVTTKGDIHVELDETRAPITVANFLSYVDSGFYKGTIFHRAVKNFVIQGGGHTPDMTEKPTNAPIRNEAANGLSNLTGALGMARDQDLDSATAQFYINTKDNVRLDGKYAVFGKVTQGMDVVRAIEDSPTHTVGQYENVPVETVEILGIVRN